MFFSSSRPGGFGGLDLYVSERADRNDDQGWSSPVNLGANVNSAAADVGPAYVEDENGSTVLYFTSNRPAPPGFGAADIYMSTLGAETTETAGLAEAGRAPRRRGYGGRGCASP